MTEVQTYSGCATQAGGPDQRAGVAELGDFDPMMVGGRRCRVDENMVLVLDLDLVFDLDDPDFVPEPPPVNGD